ELGARHGDHVVSTPVLEAGRTRVGPLRVLDGVTGAEPVGATTADRVTVHRGTIERAAPTVAGQGVAGGGPGQAEAERVEDRLETQLVGSERGVAVAVERQIDVVHRAVLQTRDVLGALVGSGVGVVELATG